MEIMHACMIKSPHRVQQIIHFHKNRSKNQQATQFDIW